MAPPKASLIKDRRLAADGWQLLATQTKPVDTLPSPDGGLLLCWSEWLAHGCGLAAQGHAVGLWLAPDADLAELEARLPELLALPLIAVDFPSFTDGRGYSLARHLRRRGFAGELRAVGEVLQDQLFFLEQCGFNAFALAPGQDGEQALAAFRTYSALPGSRRRVAAEAA